jgi:transcriptional regulator GlxA family with amidase domain
MLGLDNAFYRSFVALLAPAIVFDADDKNADKRAMQADALDQVCDYIQANLELPITLTDLERISGLSARGLQYAFRRRFDCTPIAWISRNRLVLARALLQAPKEGTTVIRAAMQAGFRYPGTFAQDYRKRYGESPSATLKLAMGK